MWTRNVTGEMTWLGSYRTTGSRSSEELLLLRTARTQHGALEPLAPSRAVKQVSDSRFRPKVCLAGNVRCECGWLEDLAGFAGPEPVSHRQRLPDGLVDCKARKLASLMLSLPKCLICITPSETQVDAAMNHAQQGQEVGGKGMCPHQTPCGAESAACETLGTRARRAVCSVP